MPILYLLIPPICNSDVNAIMSIKIFNDIKGLALIIESSRL